MQFMPGDLRARAKWSGATLNASERMNIAGPAPGNRTACVEGFTVATAGGDRFTLRILIDGLLAK